MYGNISVAKVATVHRIDQYFAKNKIIIANFNGNLFLKSFLPLSVPLALVSFIHFFSFITFHTQIITCYCHHSLSICILR